MRKNVWGIIQKIVVSLTVASVTAAYAMPVVALEGGEEAHAEHTHDGIVFQPWESDSEFPSDNGSWYLTKDIIITKSGTFSDETIACVNINNLNLCLNGHTVTFRLSNDHPHAPGGYDIYAIYNTGVFNIYDNDDNNGKIVSESVKINATGVGYQYFTPFLLSQADAAKTNIYGGTLEICTYYDWLGCVIVNSENATVTIDGGKIDRTFLPIAPPPIIALMLSAMKMYFHHLM